VERVVRKRRGAYLLFSVFLVCSFCFAGEAENLVGQSQFYEILKVNLHAHTTYSDGSFSPAELVNIYKDAGYDVLAITDHSTVSGYTEALAEGERVGLTVICGEEVTCSWPDGSWKHVTALFTQDSVGIAEDADVEVEAIFEAIHAQNGIGIVAHPWFAWQYWQDYTNESYIDGWEVDYSMAWVLETDYIYMLSHDFHDETFLPILSRFWTYLLAENRTEAGVKDALLARRIVVYGDGTLYGSEYALSLYYQNENWEDLMDSDNQIQESPSPTLLPTPTQVAEPTLNPAVSPSQSPLPSTDVSPSPESTVSENGASREAQWVVALVLTVAVIAVFVIVVKNRGVKKRKP
jgi:hypothetical protein